MTIKELESKEPFYDNGWLNAINCGYLDALKDVLELIDECKYLTKTQKFMLKQKIKGEK